jgi:hypothetical protein
MRRDLLELAAALAEMRVATLLLLLSGKPINEPMVW